ncbi:MAG TPA: glycosyltransferase, partial [Chthoniobacteraceae bacterium]|nr:glycosyltransferase [Chthoniobacteraceae bacterium]
MKILLVANYENDGQRSMQRFATMLETELRKGGADVEVIRPRAFFGRIVRGAAGPGKWLGYIDKFFIFPFELMRKAGRAGPGCVVHICDHSNAFYTRWLRGVPHVVTCSDVLAIRSARGEFPRHRTGFAGRQLQRMILAGLRRARRITCISEATRKDLLRLLGGERGDVDVTCMGVDKRWMPMPADEAARRLQALPDVKQPYILHVGGDQWYKNREAVVKLHEALGGGTGLVMVGPGMGSGAPVSISGVDDETLRALYSAAELLLFP